MTLIIVPLVAQYILDAIYFVNGHFWDFVMDLDEYSPFMDKVEVCIEGVRDEVYERIPRILVNWGHKVSNILENVPESVWNTGTKQKSEVHYCDCQRLLAHTLYYSNNDWNSPIDTLVVHSGLSSRPIHYLQD